MAFGEWFIVACNVGVIICCGGVIYYGKKMTDLMRKR